MLFVECCLLFVVDCLLFASVVCDMFVVGGWLLFMMLFVVVCCAWLVFVVRYIMFVGYCLLFVCSCFGLSLFDVCLCVYCCLLIVVLAFAFVGC